MITENYKNRGYQILMQFGNLIDAIAQFEFRGYQISFSTVGLSEGGCPLHVVIYGGDKFETVIKSDCCTVQEAIDHIATHLSPLETIKG
jgi:hypothetical protein